MARQCGPCVQRASRLGAEETADEAAHQADEYISIESLTKSMKIIAYAIVKLAGV